MFTNIPAKCKIQNFTISGVLVDEFEVEHSEANSDAIYSNGNTTLRCSL